MTVFSKKNSDLNRLNKYVQKMVKKKIAYPLVFLVYDVTIIL